MFSGCMLDGEYLAGKGPRAQLGGQLVAGLYILAMGNHRLILARDNTITPAEDLQGADGME